MANKPQPNFEFCNNYGENYKRLRTDKGLTQKELAKALNIVHSTISDIEKSKNPPTIEQLQAYHKYFGVSYEYLLGETKAQSLDIQMICEYTGLSENAVEKLHEFYTAEYGHKYVERVVGLLTIEAEPVKHGKWENDKLDIPRCSCCSYIPEFNRHIDDYYYSDFCPNCGARMGGGSE